MNAFVLLTAISLALAGTSVSSSPSEGEEGTPRDGLKYREQGVSQRGKLSEGCGAFAVFTVCLEKITKRHLARTSLVFNCFPLIFVDRRQSGI